MQSLSGDELKALAVALRSGRLPVPPTGLAVSRLCPGCDHAAVAQGIARLVSDGMSSAHLLVLLDAVAEQRAIGGGPGGESAELVWTGPEASGTASRDTAVVVRELFMSAMAEVVVAGYAVYQGRSVFAALAERMAANPNLKVRMFLDISRHPTDTSLDSELVLRFAHRFRTDQWPGGRLPEIFYDPRSLRAGTGKRASLHAKCVVIDRAVAFVSSANFTEAAQERNIEVGALIRSPRFAEQLAGHFEYLAEEGALKHVLFG